MGRFYNYWKDFNNWPIFFLIAIMLQFLCNNSTTNKSFIVIFYIRFCKMYMWTDFGF
jgi:hypothetical protein